MALTSSCQLTVHRVGRRDPAAMLGAPTSMSSKRSSGWLHPFASRRSPPQS